MGGEDSVELRVGAASASASSAPSKVATARQPRRRVRCPPSTAFTRVSVSSLSRRTVGRMPRCVASRSAAAARREVGKGPRTVRRDCRHPPDAHCHLGEDAERALGPEEELPQVGAGGARGRDPERQLARRGRYAKGVDELVEVGRSRVTPARSSVSPRIRRSSRTRSSAGSGRACSRARRSSSSACGPVVPAPKVASSDCSSSSSRAAVGARSSAITASCGTRLGVDAADHRRAAAERHDGDPVLVARRKDREHLVVRPGRHDGIGRGLRVVEAAPQQIGRALAAEMQHPDRVIPRRARLAHDGARAIESRRSSRRDGTSVGALRRGTGRGFPARTVARIVLAPAGSRAGLRAPGIPVRPRPCRRHFDRSGHRCVGRRRRRRHGDSMTHSVLLSHGRWPAPTPRPRSSTRRSKRCSSTASAGRRHPISHADAGSHDRRCTATGPTRKRCSRRSSPASCSPRCRRRVTRSIDLEDCVAALVEHGGPDTAAAARRPAARHRPRALRALHPRSPRDQPAGDPRRTRARDRGRPARRLGAPGRRRRNSRRWCCSSSSRRCSPLRSWPNGCRPSHGAAELSRALSGYLGRRGMTTRVLGSHPVAIRAPRGAPAARDSMRSRRIPTSTCS